MNRFLFSFFKKIALGVSLLCSTLAFGQSEPPVAPQSQSEVLEIPVPAPVFRGAVISGVTLICKGSETLLKVEGDYESFEWNTGSTDRMIRVKEEGKYEVTVKTKAGCSFTSSVNVEVKPCT